MTSMANLSALTLGAALLMAAPAAGAGPPAQLLGKSVVATWDESRIQRNVGESQFRPVHASHTISVYVGASGRVFSRLTITTRAGTGSSDQVQGQAGSSPNFRARVPSFTGRSMILFMPFSQGGMRRLIVDFDAGFTTCTARVSHAKQEGASTSYARSLITKRMVEFQSSTTSGEACSVRSGNVFAGE